LLTKDLIKLLNNELNSHNIKDYCPNGLQVEGAAQCNKIVTGVTASLALIERAIEVNADAILVHHGYFWKGEASPIVGMKKKRLSLLLQHQINLIAYHLPIDVHPSMGNNAQLGEKLCLRNIKPLTQVEPTGIVMCGDLPEALTHNELVDLIEAKLNRKVISVGNKSSIQRLSWCTGGGQSFIDQVAHANESLEETDKSIDAFISGEISEQTTHSALEQNIDFFAAGHHATERYGVKAIGEWLADEHGLDVSFIDIDNPA
jgi:dinuclear metal center YbgI/SA1388 family protein